MRSPPVKVQSSRTCVMIPKETLSLLRRLQSSIGRWPVDTSRKGRDLGEFLRTSYQQKFKDQVKNNVCRTVLFLPCHISIYISCNETSQHQLCIAYCNELVCKVCMVLYIFCIMWCIYPSAVLYWCLYNHSVRYKQLSILIYIHVCMYGYIYSQW